MRNTDLQARIQQAELIFFTRASRLLDEAEAVRQQRDELLDLLRLAEKAERRQEEATDG